MWLTAQWAAVKGMPPLQGRVQTGRDGGFQKPVQEVVSRLGPLGLTLGNDRPWSMTQLAPKCSSEPQTHLCGPCLNWLLAGDPS